MTEFGPLAPQTPQVVQTNVIMLTRNVRPIAVRNGEEVGEGSGMAGDTGSGRQRRTGGKSGEKKRYQTIAQQLTADIRNRRFAPGGRLPSERTLAQWHGVHRQTVRRALQDLRERGMVYSDRRGTYARPAPDDEALARPGGTGAPASFPGKLCGVRAAATTTSSLGRAPLPAEVAGVLGAPAGSQALVLRHRVLDGGSIAQSSLSYFAEALLAEVPELREAATAASHGEHPDLSGLYGWLPAAGLLPVSRDTIAVLPPGRIPEDAPGLEVGGPLLGVRRTVHDQYGRALIVTDFRICAGAAELVYESSLV